MTTKRSPRRRRRAEKTQCGNCLDGKLVMAGETCGVCGHSEPVKPPARTIPDPEFLVIGNLSVSRLKGGKLWLNHQHGEGMEVPEEKLARVLEKFFWREF